MSETLTSGSFENNSEQGSSSAYDKWADMIVENAQIAKEKSDRERQSQKQPESDPVLQGEAMEAFVARLEQDDNNMANPDVIQGEAMQAFIDRQELLDEPDEPGQEETSTQQKAAFEFDVSKLDLKTREDLRNELLNILEDERKGRIGNTPHTKEDFDRYKREAIARAFSQANKIAADPDDIDDEPAPIIGDNDADVIINRAPGDRSDTGASEIQSTDTGSNPESTPEAEKIDQLEQERDSIDKQIRELDENINKLQKGDEEEDKEAKEAAERLAQKEKAEREKRISELEKEINGMRPDLAELYARNRRIFVGAKNRADFIEAKTKYGDKLDELTRLKAKNVYEAGRQEIDSFITGRLKELGAENAAKLAEFIGDGTSKSEAEIQAEQERLLQESNRVLQEENAAKERELKAKVNAAFLSDYLSEQNQLEEATIDRIDNGTVYRRFVNKVINNKALKGVLVAAGVAGLAITGIGLATGTMAAGLSYTAGGVVAGAAKGAFAGGLMSRQNSANSAVRGFATDEAIKNKLKNIDATAENSNTKNVASWLMAQYSEANETDHASNVKRSLISAGLGAALGAAASGVHISKIGQVEETGSKLIGTEEVKIEIDKFNDVNIPKGHGAYDTFTQMGGNPNDLQKALDIMYDIDAKYGLSPGSNGETVGFNGTVGKFAHTYPGPINTWPKVAQSYIREVAEEWAKQGLIPATRTGGAPIYDSTAIITTKYIPNEFLTFLAQATPVVGAGVMGGAIGARANGQQRSETTQPNNPPKATDNTESNTEPPAQPVESMAESPADSTSETPEPTPENITSHNQFDGVRNLINQNPNFVGGPEGVAILTGAETEPDPARYQAYWDGLDDLSRVYVRSIIDNMNISSLEENGPEWGRAFREWLNEAESQENTQASSAA